MRTAEIIMIIAASTLDVTIAHAQESDLLQIYQQALLNDAQYNAEKAHHRTGQEHWLQGRSGLLPKISLDAQTHWSKSDYQAPTGNIEQKRKNRSYGIQLVQPIFRWQNWIEFKQGELQRRQAEIRLENVRQTLMLRVAHAYFDVLSATDVLKAVRDLHAADGEQLASAKKNFAIGNASIIDVHETQASFDRSTAKLIQSKSDLNLTQNYLFNITGEHPGLLRRLEDNVILLPPQPQKLSIWVKAAQQSSLAVKEQELILDIATNKVRIQKAEHLPSIDLIVRQSMQQNPNYNTSRTDSSSIGIQLSMPLYSGGMANSSIRQAVAMKEKKEFDLEDARRTATLAARKAWSGVMDGIAKENALKAAKSSALSAVASNKIGYKIGVRISIDVLEAQKKYSDIVQNLSRTRYDILLAQLQLKAATGALTEIDISEINALLSGEDTII